MSISATILKHYTLKMGVLHFWELLLDIYKLGFLIPWQDWQHKRDKKYKFRQQVWNRLIAKPHFVWWQYLCHYNRKPYFVDFKTHCSFNLVHKVLFWRKLSFMTCINCTGNEASYCREISKEIYSFSELNKPLMNLAAIKLYSLNMKKY